MVYESPSIKRRGEIARLRADVHAKKPEHGEHHGTLRCVCGATLHFSIQSGGLSRAHCMAACGVRWCQ